MICGYCREEGRPCTPKCFAAFLSVEVIEQVHLEWLLCRFRNDLLLNLVSSDHGERQARSQVAKFASFSLPFSLQRVLSACLETWRVRAIAILRFCCHSSSNSGVFQRCSSTCLLLLSKGVFVRHFAHRSDLTFRCALLLPGFSRCIGRRSVVGGSRTKSQN